MSVHRLVISDNGRPSHMPAAQADALKAKQAADPKSDAYARLGIASIGDEDYYEFSNRRNGMEFTDYTTTKPEDLEAKTATMGETGLDKTSLPDMSRVPADAPKLNSQAHDPLARISVVGGLATVQGETTQGAPVGFGLAPAKPIQGGNNFSSLADAEAKLSGAIHTEAPAGTGTPRTIQPDPAKVAEGDQRQGQESGDQGEAGKSKEPAKAPAKAAAKQSGKPAASGRKVGTGTKVAAPAAAPAPAPSSVQAPAAGLPPQDAAQGGQVGDPGTTSATGDNQGTDQTSHTEGENLNASGNDAK